MAQNYNNVPANLRPISAWGYVGYQLLFSIPLIGFILVIVFSFDDSNINRRNYARSYLIAFIMGLILVILMGILGVSLLGFLGNTLT